MKVEITRVTPLYPGSIFVQWTVEDPTNVLKSFDLLLGGSPEGPFETVASNLADSTFFYNAPRPETQSLSAREWYVVKAVPLSGAINAVLSEPQTYYAEAYGHRARVVRKARRDLNVTLSKLNGVRITVLKRKTFGSRCESCFDPLTKSTLLSHCAECYGTGYTGGYHTPYATWGKIDPAVVQERHDRTGPTEVAMFGITMLDYPLVEIDDIIVENSTNRRFLVKMKTSTQGSGVVVHQDLQVSELSRSASEYLVPVDFNK